MLVTICETVLFPWCCAVAVLLLPRLPWSADSGCRVASWTGGLAIATAMILSLRMVEGAAIWSVTERWHMLVVSAGTLAVGSIVAQCILSRGSALVPIALILAVGASIVVLAFPNHDSLTIRILLAAGAVIAARAVLPAASIEPFRINLLLAISTLALAALLLAAGSMKLAMVAVALAATCATGATLAARIRSFSPGPAFTLFALTMSFVLALYGCAYHAESSVPIGAWCIVWLTPLTIAPGFARRSSRVATAVMCLAISICVVVVGECARRALAEDDQPPYSQSIDTHSYT